MTLPSFLIGIVISSLYGAGFHLWRGGGLGRLLFYLVLGWVGFWTGHLLLGGLLGWTFFSLGPLHLGAASLGAIASLGIGYWLSLIEPQS